MLAFTSKGDGPKSNPKSATTKEDGKKSELTIAYTSVYCYARPCQLSKISIKPKNLRICENYRPFIACITTLHYWAC